MSLVSLTTVNSLNDLLALATLLKSVNLTA
jgi:hypothetical protein